MVEVITGIVVIGRNEGQRLTACLRSLVKSQFPFVYVDSGSSDGSPQQAESFGADVVALDMSIPFTAARARNVGLTRLKEKWPYLSYVQFVDGDCIVVDRWPNLAKGILDERSDVAVVCGRRRELHPDATIYNRLCDVEWDTPVGEATTCGGDAMMRVEALREVGGYREDLIAGEEPELCLRLRERGWKVWRLPDEMTLHDADIRCFNQWWTRTVRGGFAYAAVYTLHANSKKRIWRRELVRAIFWGPFLLLTILVASTLNTVFLGMFLIYPIQIVRLAFRRGAGNILSWQYGVFMTIAKFAEAVGALKFFVSRITRRKTSLIEYK